MEQSVNNEAAVAASAPAGLSTKGIFQVFTSPGEFFEQLKSHPRILVPYLVLAAILIVTFVLVADLLWEMQKNTPEFQEQLQGQPLPPEAEKYGKYASMVMGPLVMLLGPLVMAAVTLLVGNFFFGGKSKYSQHLSVMLYGEIVFAVGFLLTAFLMLAKGSALVSLSPAVLVADAGPTSVIYQLLVKLSIFHIWEYIVVGIGLAAVYSIPRNKGYLISVISLGSLALLGVLLSSIGSIVG